MFASIGLAPFPCGVPRSLSVYFPFSMIPAFRNFSTISRNLLSEVKERTQELVNTLLEVWENSVKATHLFLSDNEIEKIKEYVPQALKEVAHLIIIENENNIPIAFMGIEGTKLEMLFIKNSERRKGLGR